MSPESQLLYAILKQTISDYIKLDPDSDCDSADYFEDEGKDFKTAEDIIFNNVPIYFGSMTFTFDELVTLFPNIIQRTPKQIRQYISKKAIEY
ncbi:MAG: hypothetical protein PHY47_01115 [Lachnospiraceae bacterium]|nr:hypothetical protein [Lachnospiraceae bacterium]